jgi:hypothetical protein
VKRRLRVGWLVALACIGLLPLFVDPNAALPGGPSLGSPWWVGVGIAFAVASFCGYAWHSRRNLAGAPGRTEIGTAEVALLIGFPLYLLFLGNGFAIQSGDTFPTRHLPSVILKHGTLDLAVLPEFQHQQPYHYATRREGAKTLSAVPLGTAILAVPYTAVGLAASRGKVTTALVSRWEKHFSALLATVSACLFFLGLRRCFGRTAALAATGVFVFATPFFTHTSQAMWSTTGETFFVVVAIFLLLLDPGRPRGALAGLAMGFAFFCRATAIFPLAGMALLLTARRLRSAFAFGLAASSVLAAVSGFHLLFYEHALGGHGLGNAHRELFGHDLSAGLLGGLFSPSRGVLVYLPYLAFLPLAWRLSWRSQEIHGWWLLSAATLLFSYALGASYFKWWGGHSIGPRNVAETAPFLALLTLPIWCRWREIRPAVRGAFIACVLFAGATQLRAAYTRNALQWNHTVEVDVHTDALWSWRNSQLAAIWWSGWTFRLDPREAAVLEENPFDPNRWHRIDLATAANARYDLDPSQPAASPRVRPRFGRIDPAAMNRPAARFHFAARGSPNAVTARPGHTPRIPTPDIRAGSIHALLSAEWRGDPRATTLVGWLRVQHSDGVEERIPLRLNVDVFAYEGEPFRARPVPAERTYFGRPDERTAIAESVFPVRHRAGIVSIQLEGAPTDPPSAVTLLALTLEAEGVSTAGGAPAGASS